MLHHQRLDFKVRQYLEKYGQMPKWNKRGYYRRIATPDTELQSHIDSLKATIQNRLNKLLKHAPHITSELAKDLPPHYTHAAYDFNKQRCKLLSSVTALVRAKAMRNQSAIEDSFYHINTAWLALHRVVHGNSVTYKNPASIVHEQGAFIPLKTRFYGRKRR